MKSPLEDGPWLELDEAASTQEVAAGLLFSDHNVPGVVFAHHQTHGKGRFGREWSSKRGDSLTFSLVFRRYVGHKEPWLIGMAVALACAKSIGARVQWPNDVVLAGKKLGGVLTELVPDYYGNKVPVVGVGINVNQVCFPPELERRAVSLLQLRGERADPVDVAKSILGEVGRLPEPKNWMSIAGLWNDLDDTSGKEFRLHSGEAAIAIGVNESGCLVCDVDGSVRTVLAADAIFGA